MKRLVLSLLVAAVVSFGQTFHIGSGGNATVPAAGVVKSNGSTLQTATPGTDYLTPSTGGVLSVLTFGAVGNGKADTTASITSGSAVLAITSTVFTSGDVGKYITVEGAGTSGGPLVTTISTFTNSNHVTLANTASTTVSSAGSIFWGHDDTTGFTSAIAAATAGQTIIVPATGGQYEIGPLVIPSNIRIEMAPGAYIMAKGGLTQNSNPSFTLFNMTDVSHVAIRGYGATVAMPFVEYKFEYNHCINIMGSSDVVVEGLYLNGCGGDGIYVSGDGNSGTYSSRVYINDVWSDHVHRNGLSVISVVGLKVTNSKFTNDCCDLDAPSYKNPGIDIEPNGSTDILQDIHFTNISTAGNQGAGISLAFSAVGTGTAPIYIQIDGLNSDSDGLGAFTAFCDSPTLIPGSIPVRGLYSYNSGDMGFKVHDWTVNAPQLDIYQPVVVNPNTGVAAQEAFAVDNGGGVAFKVGNVAIHHASVTDTRGTPKTNFAYYVADFSNNGVSNVIVTLNHVSGVINGNQTEGAYYSIEEPYLQTSATPIFDASVRSNEDNAYFRVSLSGNKTSSTLINMKPGQLLTFSVCQPSSGGPYTFVPPTNLKGFTTIGTTANTCTSQNFIVDANGTTARSTGAGVLNQ